MSNILEPVTWQWSAGQLPERHSVYHDAAYQQLFAECDGSKARLLEGVIGKKQIFLPVLVKELGGGIKEAYSAYGYGGFMGDISLSEDHFDGMKAFLASESIVALFLRHSPFLHNHELVPAQEIVINRYTYAASLKEHESFDDYVNELPQKVRWSVNFARRSGLRIDFRELSNSTNYRNIDAFYCLYDELMEQKQTYSYYRFSKKIFHDHIRLIGRYCELAEVIDPKSNRALGGAFFLFDNMGWVHYHLSAASKDVMKLQGMEYLIATAIHRYGQMGYQFIHLGGGHSLDESDGLSRFKSKFSNNRLEFYCSKIVCDECGYESERNRIPLKNSSLFLISDARQS